MPLAELVDYIDWSPFFSTWELTGKFPAILDDDRFGAAARALYDDARAMLGRIVAENWFAARGVVGLWPANAEGDDILIYADEARAKPVATLHTLRQQLESRDGRANVALADFVAPRHSGIAGLYRRLHRHRRHRRGPVADRFKRRQRRLLVHHGQSAGGPARGSLRRAPARQGAARTTGATAGESLAPHELLAETSNTMLYQ